MSKEEGRRGKRVSKEEGERGGGWWVVWFLGRGKGKNYGKTKQDTTKSGKGVGRCYEPETSFLVYYDFTWGINPFMNINNYESIIKNSEMDQGGTEHLGRTKLVAGGEMGRCLVESARIITAC